MKRIIIIGEGQTEQSFCNDVLQPFFSLHGIYIENPTIKKTHGGIVSWEALKYQINKHLSQDPTAYVTTFIDYYGIHAHHKYPKWLIAEQVSDKEKRVKMIEDGMLDEIDNSFKNRFVPYIQLHEFEGLLFCDKTVFDKNFEKGEFSDYDYLVQTINDYPNPELINKGSQTAPSKRLTRILKNYYSENENMKVLYGSLLAQEIGLNKIRSKCPRFDEWIKKIETI